MKTLFRFLHGERRDERLYKTRKQQNMSEIKKRYNPSRNIEENFVPLLAWMEEEGHELNKTSKQQASNNMARV